LPPQWRAGFVPDGPRGTLTFQRLPSVDHVQPESLVGGITRRCGKATAFISTPPELFYTHVARLSPTAPFSGEF